MNRMKRRLGRLRQRGDDLAVLDLLSVTKLRLFRMWCEAVDEVDRVMSTLDAVRKVNEGLRRQVMQLESELIKARGAR